MDHIDMKRIEKIPIKAIGYDLRLDLIDEMEVEDVAELTKVDRQFRSILLREPWRVFGKHIDEIRICPFAVPHPSIQARKLESSSLRCIANLNDFSRHALPPALFERVRSAQLFTVVFDDSRLSRFLHSMLLENPIAILKPDSLAKWNCVNELRCDMTEESLSSFQDDYVNFLPTVMGRARLNFCSNQSIAETLSTVIETRLGNCKEIAIRCTDNQYKEIHERLARAKFEMIVFDAIQRYTGSPSMLQEIIRHIVTKGIPSTYEKAAIFIKGQFRCTNEDILELFSKLISDFSAQFTELRQIEEENHEEIGRIHDIVIDSRKRFAIAKNTSNVFPELQRIEKEYCKEITQLLGIVIKELNKFPLAKDVMLSEDNLYYTKVDGGKKTIYVIAPRHHLFFAKNISIY